MLDQKLAIVTGASRGIGLSISKKLISLGYEVIGLCKNPHLCEFTHFNFQLESVDLTKVFQIKEWIGRLEKNRKLAILVHNAGVGYFSPLEELNWEQIQEMILLHITAPMLITNALLRRLKENQGRIFLIGSIAGTKVSPWGAIYGSTKAGLIHFGRELFQEVRKSGVKVTNIIPDITETDFYKDLNFEPDDDPKSYILADCVADAIENVLAQREGTVVSEIAIQPEVFKIKKKPKKEL